MKDKISGMTIDAMRSMFRCAVRKLQDEAKEISDWLVRDATIRHLEVFLAHSEVEHDPERLREFCNSAFIKIEGSIAAARSKSRRNDRKQKPEVEDSLRSIMYAALHRPG